jgi:3-deoxy-7-phosphoheptulonate synthase
MLIVMRLDASGEEIERVKSKIGSLGFRAHEIPGAQRVAIGITGNTGKVDPEQFLNLPGVVDAIPVSKPYKLVSRDVKPENTVIQFSHHSGVHAEIGGPEIAVMAGPCSVESRSQILEIAHFLKEQGVKFLRGGAFKPRTSPYSFQGLKSEGLAYLREASEKYGLFVVTEVKDSETLPSIVEHADVLQIGARNMHNFSLLEKVGESNKPVLLKRGFAATVEELLMAAEYIVSKGNYQVVLCERGIRTFETSTRNTLDLNAIPVIKKFSHLPIIVDPSHGTGAWDLVTPMSLAALMAGADGLMVEVHQNPELALSDGFQSLKPERFAALVQKVSKVAALLGRTFSIPAGVQR